MCEKTPKTYSITRNRSPSNLEEIEVEETNDAIWSLNSQRLQQENSFRQNNFRERKKHEKQGPLLPQENAGPVRRRKTEE